ncbi:hypothetical protein STEG23_031328 [Scotinomys teguina]
MSSNLGTPLQIQNDLHRQQYSYIDAVCYQNQLHWFAKFFPYLVLLHTLIFAACSNFWLHYLSTSSRLEHFVAILPKCFDSPWTTRALSETVAEQSVRPLKCCKPKTLLITPGGPADNDANKPSSPYPQPGLESPTIESSTSSVLDKKEGEQAKAIFESEKVPPACGTKGHHLSGVPEADNSQSHFVCLHYNVCSIFFKLHNF